MSETLCEDFENLLKGADFEAHENPQVDKWTSKNLFCRWTDDRRMARYQHDVFLVEDGSQNCFFVESRSFYAGDGRIVNSKKNLFCQK